MLEVYELESDLLWKSLQCIFAKRQIELARLPSCTISSCCFCAVLYRESIIIGETNMSKQQIHALIQEMGNNYKGNLYHLLQRNCNHFSDELAFKLCKAHAPAWVSLGSCLTHLRTWGMGKDLGCCSVVQYQYHIGLCNEHALALLALRFLMYKTLRGINYRLHLQSCALTHECICFQLPKTSWFFRACMLCQVNWPY